MNLKFDHACSFSEGLAAVKINGLYGYINQQSQMLIEPQFTDAGDFNDNVAIVGIKNKQVCIDRSGKIISKKYDCIITFSEGMAIVESKGKRGYINIAGKLVIPVEFISALNFSEGLAPVYIDKKKLGFINKAGELVIPAKFKWSSGFNEGLAPILLNNFGYINNLGEIMIAPDFVSARKFSNGLAVVCSEIGKHKYINKKGKVIIEGPFNSAADFDSNGLAIVQPMDKAGQAFGCINKQGEWIIPADFKNISPFENGIAKVESDYLSGFINEQGEFIDKSEYYRINTASFTEGLARVQPADKYGYYGFIDINGKMVIEPVFHWALPFKDGLAVVQINNKWGYINTAGKQVI